MVVKGSCHAPSVILLRSVPMHQDNPLQRKDCESVRGSEGVSKRHTVRPWLGTWVLELAIHIDQQWSFATRGWLGRCLGWLGWRGQISETRVVVSTGTA